MKIMHSLKGLMIKNKELKKDIANLVAVSIFMDSIVRASEIKTGYEILENLFNGEDYEYLKEEVDLLLEEFQEDANAYLESREKTVLFIKENEDMKAELVEIVKLIFKSDHEIHRKEQDILNLFEREIGEKHDKKI